MAPAIAQLRMLAWAASANLCAGADLAALAELLPEFPNAAGYESLLAAVILHGLQTGLAVAHAADLLDVQERWKPAFFDIVRLIEQHSLAGTGRRLKELVVWSVSAADMSRSFVLEHLQVAVVDTDKLMPVSQGGRGRYAVAAGLFRRATCRDLCRPPVGRPLCSRST